MKLRWVPPISRGDPAGNRACDSVRVRATRDRRMCAHARLIAGTWVHPHREAARLSGHWFRDPFGRPRQDSEDPPSRMLSFQRFVSLTAATANGIDAPHALTMEVSDRMESLSEQSDLTAIPRSNSALPRGSSSEWHVHRYPPLQMPFLTDLPHGSSDFKTPEL